MISYLTGFSGVQRFHGEKKRCLTNQKRQFEGMRRCALGEVFENDFRLYVEGFTLESGRLHSMSLSSHANSQASSTQIQGYCAHCRNSRPMLEATQIKNRRGGSDLKGQCGKCGKSMYRLGGWNSIPLAPTDEITSEHIS